VALDEHLRRLAEGEDSRARRTVVVVGGGFTGIEVATEMPSRLAKLFGKDAATRVVIVDRNPFIASDMGENPRAVIEGALRELGVETRLGAGAASLDAGGVTLTTGERIECSTVVW